MRPSELRRYCELSEDAERLLSTLVNRLKLSARAHDRVLKVARTIADLADATQIEAEHLAEAAQYRQLDRVWGMTA
jgi:magnesium chelatase family protein